MNGLISFVMFHIPTIFVSMVITLGLIAQKLARSIALLFLFVMILNVIIEFTFTIIRFTSYWQLSQSVMKVFTLV